MLLDVKGYIIPKGIFHSVAFPTNERESVHQDHQDCVPGLILRLILPSFLGGMTL